MVGHKRVGISGGHVDVVSVFRVHYKMVLLLLRWYVPCGEINLPNQDDFPTLLTCTYVNTCTTCGGDGSAMEKVSAETATRIGAI